MGQRNLSGDVNFDFFVNWDDATLKLQSVEVVNRYANKSVKVAIVPVDVNGVEDVSSTLTRTFLPLEDTVINAPQSGAHAITLHFNAKGIIAGYDVYFETQ